MKNRKEHPRIKVKLLRTIKNGMGDIFKKGSIAVARKMYGGYELVKKSKREDGCIIAVTRVPAKDFSTQK